MEDAVARLAHAQRIANYDGQKEALGVIARLVAGMPSSKSFVPMTADALRREGEKRRAREPFTTAAELRAALEGPQAGDAMPKAAPLPPAAAEPRKTYDAQLQQHATERVAQQGHRPPPIATTRASPRNSTNTPSRWCALSARCSPTRSSASASDIHFEPEQNFLRIRYRIDGVLRQIRSLHKTYWPAMAVRLKVMAKMNIAETRAPQDGRISLHVGPGGGFPRLQPADDARRERGAAHPRPRQAIRT